MPNAADCNADGVKGVEQEVACAPRLSPAMKVEIDEQAGSTLLPSGDDEPAETCLTASVLHPHPSSLKASQHQQILCVQKGQAPSFWDLLDRITNQSPLPTLRQDTSLELHMFVDSCLHKVAFCAGC